MTERSRWIFILPSIFLLALLGLPVFALLFRSATPVFWTSITSPQALTALRLSLATSLLSLLLSVLTGTPLAYILARWRLRGKTGIELLVDLPVVLPPSVAGLALLMAFGRQGVFGAPLAALGISLPFTGAAVVLAQTFVAAPFYVRSARIGFTAIDRQFIESAHVEGASQWQIFTHILLPLAGRAMISGAILAWARALGEFGATILFAGNLAGRTQTMPLAIYLGLERDVNVAISISTLLVVTSVILLSVMRRLEKNVH